LPASIGSFRAIRRWIVAYPPKTAKGEEIEISQAWIDHQAADETRVAVLRERLSSLGWFRKALKEPLARMANKEDDCEGTIWESRCKSIAIQDDHESQMTGHFRAVGCLEMSHNWREEIFPFEAA